MELLIIKTKENVNLMSAHNNGNVRVMKNIVTDATQQCTTDTPQTTCSGNNQVSTNFLRHFTDSLAGTGRMYAFNRAVYLKEKTNLSR
jgi:hypothetical protein